MASTHHQLVADALTLLETIEELHPSGALLATFVTEALDPTTAARFLHTKLLAGDAQALVSTWTQIVKSVSVYGQSTQPVDGHTREVIVSRDGGKCCITGKSGSHWDPLVVVPILPIPVVLLTNEVLVNEMLGAFFGPNYRDWWLSYAAHPDSLSPYCSHWLLRKSAAEAFTQGLVRLDRIQPSMVEYKISHVSMRLHDPIGIQGYFPLLGDHSRSRVQKVDPRLLGTHARLSQSIQLLQIAQDIKQDNTPAAQQQQQQSRGSQALLLRPSTRLHSYLTNLASKFVLSGWLVLPSVLRVATYKLLQRIGEALYNQGSGFATMQRLPFGLYLKSLRDSSAIRNEFAALQVVRRLTSIPVPQPLDVIPSKTREPRKDDDDDDDDDDDTEPLSYLLESRLPGVPLSRCQYVLSDKDCDRIEEQLADFLGQIRAIPKGVNPDMAICSVLGEQCTDHRICGGTPVGPFENEAEFNQVLRFPDDPARQGHRILFTHADLNPRNILVSHGLQADGYFGWGVTGIVDWETAGYYPEYWDYTKALFEGFRWTTRYKNLIKSVFRRLGQYDGELDVEVRSWESGDGV